MRRLTKLLALVCGLSSQADPCWTTNAGQGVMTSANLTYGTSIVSVAFWVMPRATNVAAGQYFIDSSTALASGTGTAPRFAIGIYNRDSAYRLDWIGKGGNYRSQSILAAPNVPLNTWVHVGGVFDATTASGNFKGYVNGVQQSLTTSGSLGSMSGTAGSNWNANKFGIGSENTNSAPANAVMAEVAVWTGELTADQFVSLAAGRPPNLIGRPPLAYWPMHPSGTETMGELVGGLALASGTYSNTNASPPIRRP